MPLGSYEWNQIKPVIWVVELLSICCNLTSSWGTLDNGETNETSKELLFGARMFRSQHRPCVDPHVVNCTPTIKGITLT